MAKRKAGSSKEGLSVAPNRRSSRRKTSDENELAVSKKTTASNRAQKTKKPLKSSKSNISKTETVKEEDTNPSQVTRFVLRSYSHLEALIHVLLSLCCHLSFASRDFLPQQCQSYSHSITTEDFLLMFSWTFHIIFKQNILLIFIV
jgi:hypothetical protein